MPNITEILENESGIQYQGPEDRTSTTGNYPVVGLIAGEFKRGCFDKPMTITKRNIRAMLGYDPENPSYAAVYDALESGVPSVQVMRIESSGCEPTQLIVPVNNFNYDGVSGISTLMEFYIDGVLHETILNEWAPSNASGRWTSNTDTSGSRYNKEQLFLGSYFDGSYNFSLDYRFCLLVHMGTYENGTYKNYLDKYDGIPLSDGNFIITGYPNTIEKYEQLTGNEWYSEYDHLDLNKIDVKFKVNPNTQSGYIDIVKMLWGQDVSVHGCARYRSTGG